MGRYLPRHPTMGEYLTMTREHRRLSSDAGSQWGLAAHPSRSDKIYRHMFPFVPGEISCFLYVNCLWILFFFFGYSLLFPPLHPSPHHPQTKSTMSPAIVQAGAGAASKDAKKESATARLLGSGKINTCSFPSDWVREKQREREKEGRKDAEWRQVETERYSMHGC